MSTFIVPVVSIRAIEPIPDADAIELAVVGDYRSVVRRGQFRPGDTAVYLPESAIVPDALLSRLGLSGKLAGAAKNRIKAIKLRGCLSQGILYDDVPSGAAEGDDVAEVLGIVKYEPPIPASMDGEVASLFGLPLRYDIENFKSFPNVLIEGELVEMTEKAHGTFCGVGVVPGLDHAEMIGGDGLVYSKGLGAKGLVFKNVPTNSSNIYMRAALALELHDRIRAAFPGRIAHVLGEVYGSGVQDLSYGRADKGFAAFDISVEGRFLDREELALACAAMGIPRLPTLYSGPFAKAIMDRETDGKTVLGNGAHIREGVVVVPPRGAARCCYRSRDPEVRIGQLPDPEGECD